MSSTSQKKRAEEAVLRMVYDLDRFEPLEDSERPDFVLRRRGGSESFGVEVTRFYHSEASARLEHIRGYAGELLEGGKHRHKDDVKELLVENATLTKADGSRSQVVTAIMETFPPVADHIQMIAERIEAKSTALSGHRVDLTHVNLILQDKTGRFSAAEPDQLVRALLRGSVGKAVPTTTFREVFYVVNLHQTRTVLPLRMLLLVSELFTFNTVRETYDREEPVVQSPDDELILFGSFMHSRGVPVVLVGGTPDESTQVILGNSGVLAGAEDSVTVRDYMDGPLPEVRVPPAHSFSENFLTFYEKYAAEHIFRSGMAFDVRK